MHHAPVRTARIEARFGSISLVRPVLELVAQCPCVTMLIRRGRLSRDEAVLDLEITGCGPEIEQVTGLIRCWGVEVKTPCKAAS